MPVDARASLAARPQAVGAADEGRRRAADALPLPRHLAATAQPPCGPRGEDSLRGSLARTNRRGRATFVKQLRRRRTYTARATAPGFGRATARVRVR